MEPHRPGAGQGASFRLLVDGSLETGLAGEIRERASELLGGSIHLDLARDGALPEPERPIRADLFLRSGALQPGTVAIVPGPLSARGLERTLGYSYRARRTALVSTAAVDVEGPAGAGRLAVLVAHEIGHLLGLRHCRAEGCVAGPVRAQEELDARRAFCERCSERLRAAPAGYP